LRGKSNSETGVFRRFMLKTQVNPLGSGTFLSLMSERVSQGSEPSLTTLSTLARLGGQGRGFHYYSHRSGQERRTGRVHHSAQHAHNHRVIQEVDPSSIRSFYLLVINERKHLRRVLLLIFTPLGE